MAKLKVKNLKSVQSSIRKEITKALRSKEIRQGVGEIVVEDIQENTIAVSSSATIAWRKYYEKANKLSPKYTRRNINFTFTGDLLKDLMNNVKAKFGGGKAEFILEQSNKKHKKYKKPNGKTSKGRALSHKEIQENIYKISTKYHYLKFTKKAKDGVLKFIREELFKRLK